MGIDSKEGLGGMGLYELKEISIFSSSIVIQKLNNLHDLIENGFSCLRVNFSPC